MTDHALANPAAPALTTPFACLPRAASWARPAGLLLAVVACASFGAQRGISDPVAMGAIAVAATASSIAGIAFSAICGAMLFHLRADPLEVVRIMMVCSIANQAAMTWALRRDIAWQQLRRFLLPGLAGVPVGVFLLLHADHATYAMALGLPMAAYGLWMLLRPPIRLRLPHPVLDTVAAFLGGITGGAAAFPSGPISIWCGMKGWDKRRQRALFQPYILTLQLAALGAISLARPHAGPGCWFDPAVLLYVPAGLLGTAFGMRMFAYVSDRQFARALNVMLFMSGLSLLS